MATNNLDLKAQLSKAKENSEVPLNTEKLTAQMQERKTIGLFLGILIAWMPFPLAFLTLRKGYSNRARYISLGWMILAWGGVLLLLGLGGADKTQSQAKEPVKEIIAQKDPAPNVNSAIVNPQQTTSDKIIISPSFDCSKASSNSEKLICSNIDLANADAKLSILYKEVLAKQSDKEQFKIEQLRWLKDRRDVCTDVETMLEVYIDRIGQLSQ